MRFACDDFAVAQMEGEHAQGESNSSSQDENLVS